jgi:hypothetical protein
MLEEIGKAIASDSGISLVFLSFLVFASVLIGLKRGRFKLKTDRFTIEGEARDKERLLMKTQKDFVKTACIGFEKRIPRFEGYDTKLGELVVEKVFDEIVDWIMINHIRDDDDYIALKQEIIWDIVSSEIIADELKTDKFKKQCYSCIEHIIKRLVQIRNGDNTGD